MSAAVRTVLVTAVLIALTVIVTDDGTPPSVPAPCGVNGAPQCRVPPPSCGAADVRDRNPTDRAITPEDGLTFRRPGDPSLPYGFNDAAVLSGQLTPQQDIALHRAVGSSLIRVVLDWGAIEETPNEFDFAATDHLYCVAAEAGVRPLFTLTGIPPWAGDDDVAACPQAPCVQPPAEEHLPAVRRFAELAAIRYPDAAAVEVWNEPNFSEFWPGPDPARYTRLLREAYLGVKAGDPELPVLGGSVANALGDDPATGTLSMRSFLTGIFEAGAADYMDALSIHAYPIGELGGPEDRFTPQVAEARYLADSFAAERTLPLWVTETGVPTEEGGFAPAVSEVTQAQQLTTIYRQLAASPTTEAVLFHTLVDPPPSVPGGPGFGWFSQPAEGTAAPKPVVCEFRRRSELPGCPNPVQLD